MTRSSRSRVLNLTRTACLSVPLIVELTHFNPETITESADALFYSPEQTEHDNDLFTLLDEHTTTTNTLILRRPTSVNCHDARHCY